MPTRATSDNKQKRNRIRAAAAGDFVERLIDLGGDESPAAWASGWIKRSEGGEGSVSDLEKIETTKRTNDDQKG